MVSKNILKTRIKRVFPFLTPFYRLYKYGFRIMRWVPTYDEDDLITNHLCDFLRDERFTKSLATTKKEGHLQLGYVVRWRLYTACWAAEHAKNLDGGGFRGVWRGIWFNQPHDHGIHRFQKSQ